jgi:hypothetical protein
MDVVSGRIVGERYQLDHGLGRGGMAQVYRALDERTGRYVALKQLSLDAERPTAAQAMFQHEYHTLVQLAHPHIVSAFEYGLDPSGAFYTMELLDGADAREATRSSALSVEQICLMLHDAASALALIHSRRMLHRDISPRNLFCGNDGRAKLIDFGSLAPMGVAASSGGTPPFVPPEVVHTQPLDARSDLYSLGALAYYMLTRRNAYPARQVRELRELWQLRPNAPHVQRPEVPRALSDLVMALLSLDPRGRPSSAAEVCERLRAIYPLPVENERLLAQAFLSTPTLVGREAEHAQARSRLLRLRRGRGGTLVISGEGGAGRSRFLSNVVLDAKLMGMGTVLVDAAAGGTSSHGLAIAIAAQVLEIVPAPSLSDAHVTTLAGLSPELRHAFGRHAEAGTARPATKRAIEAAWLELIRVAASEQPLVLAIDDVQGADGSSLGLFGQLAAVAREQRVLLAVTSTSSVVTGQTIALAQLVKPEHRIELKPLDAELVRELLGSLFGNVSGLDEAARFIHEVSQGSPDICMQYAQYLVDQGLARYDGGAWRLPERLREHALPATLAAMLERRVSVLSADAFELALALALSRDETRAEWQPDKRIAFEDFGKLLGGVANPAALRAFAALDELLRVGFVEPRDTDYVLAQGAIVDAVLRLADEAARLRVHRRLAEVFAQSHYHDSYLVAEHLQRAGDYDKAQPLLLNVLASGHPDWTWRQMRISVASVVAGRQLAWWAAQGGKPVEGIALRRLLLASCSVSDWTSARFGDQQLDQLDEDIGLCHWDALDPSLPDQERLARCMELAEQAYATQSAETRGLPPDRAATELAISALSLSGAYVNSGDVVRARRLSQMAERLRSFSALHALLADLSTIALDRLAGRNIGSRVLDCIPRLMAATVLPDVLRLGAVAVYLHIQAIEDARSGRRRALELMDMVAASTGDAMFIVVHARYLAHGFGGKASHARRLRKQLELTTADDVWRRYAYVFVEAQLHGLTGDLAELNATTQTVADLAAKFDAWKPFLTYCRAQTYRLHGELGAAEHMLADAIAAVAPGEHRAYPMLALAYADVLLSQGRFDEALQTAVTFAEQARAHQLCQAALVAALRMQSLALSARGEHADAQERLREAFALARSIEQGGLPLATLYEAQARLANAENEPAEGLKALAALRELIEHADAPALFGAYEALRVENKRQIQGSLQPGADADSMRSLPGFSHIQATTSSSLSSSSSDLSSEESAPSAPTREMLTSRETHPGKKLRG